MVLVPQKFKIQALLHKATRPANFSYSGFHSLANCGFIFMILQLYSYILCYCCLHSLPFIGGELQSDTQAPCACMCACVHACVRVCMCVCPRVYACVSCVHVGRQIAVYRWWHIGREVIKKQAWCIIFHDLTDRQLLYLSAWSVQCSSQEWPTKILPTS